MGKNNIIAREMDIQRRMVACATTRAWRETPHVSFLYEPDATDFCTAFRSLRASFKNEGRELSLNTILIKAIVEGLKSAPLLNSACTFDAETRSGKIETFDRINVGIPWLLDDSRMITLTAFDLGEKSLRDISAQIAGIRQKVASTDFDALFRATATGRLPDGARVGGADCLSPADITGGTVTVSNLGSICRTGGAVALLEIIPPQVLAVGISALQDKPGVFVDADGEKQIGIRQTIPICLAFDHRALDFSDIVPLIRRLDGIFANPEEIFAW